MVHSSLHRVRFLLRVWKKCRLSASSNKKVCIKLWEVHMSDERALMGETFVYCFSFFYMLVRYYSLWLLYYMIFHSIYDASIL